MNQIPEKFIPQLNQFHDYLLTNTVTATMASIALKIPQKNICRYKRELEKNNRLWEVKFAKCKTTGFEAWYITTNPDEKIEDNQLELFGELGETGEVGPEVGECELCHKVKVLDTTWLPEKLCPDCAPF